MRRSTVSILDEIYAAFLRLSFREDKSSFREEGSTLDGSTLSDARTWIFRRRYRDFTLDHTFRLGAL